MRLFCAMALAAQKIVPTMMTVHELGRFAYILSFPKKMDTVRPSDSAPLRDTMIPTAPRLEEFHRLRLNLQNFRAAAQWSVTASGHPNLPFMEARLLRGIWEHAPSL